MRSLGTPTRSKKFFLIFKRGVIGTYHHISEAHLGCYTAELDFRYNTRKLNDTESADIALQGILASVSLIGGLICSPPKHYKAPPIRGKRRKRYFD